MFNLISKVTLTRKHIGNNFARSNYTLKECISRLLRWWANEWLILDRCRGSTRTVYDPWSECPCPWLGQTVETVWTRPWMRNLRQQLNSTLSADGTSRTWCPFLKGHCRYPSNLCPWPPLPLPSSFHIPNNNRLATPSRKGKRNRRRNSRPHRVNACTFAFVAPAKSARMHLWTTLLVIIDCSTRHLLMHSGVNDHFSTVFLHGKISSSRFFI